MVFVNSIRRWILDSLTRSHQNARYDGLSAGVHVLPLDVASLASGMYIVRVTAGMDVQELRCVRQ